MIIDKRTVCPSCGEPFGNRKDKRCPNCGTPLFYDGETIGVTLPENKHAWLWSMQHWHRIVSILYIKNKGD